MHEVDLVFVDTYFIRSRIHPTLSGNRIDCSVNRNQKFSGISKQKHPIRHQFHSNSSPFHSISWQKFIRWIGAVTIVGLRATYLMGRQLRSMEWDANASHWCSLSISALRTSLHLFVYISSEVCHRIGNENWNERKSLSRKKCNLQLNERNMQINSTFSEWSATQTYVACGKQRNIWKSKISEWFIFADKVCVCVSVSSWQHTFAEYLHLAWLRLPHLGNNSDSMVSCYASLSQRQWATSPRADSFSLCYSFW